MTSNEIYNNQILRLNEIFYRLQEDQNFKKSFNSNPHKTLNEIGITLDEAKAFIMTNLNDKQIKVLESFNKTMLLADRFKQSIKTSLDQIESGYKGSMYMYWIAFLTGVGLIIAAVVFAFMGGKNLLSIVFGSLGTLDLLVFFFMKPPLELQNSRIGFARLEAAFMNWFIDLNNINSVLIQLGSTYSKINPTNGQPELTKEDFKEIFEKSIAISSHTMANTEATLKMMGTIIRETDNNTKAN